ncbi:hypothetical protein CPB83DRAFT_905956 [Crepidotus variabilis]|uniref:Uncharacterized protein n=1 Tax=Crepidotus variabilis TaxID=179855 RepID=A0A9P6JQT6_9AGAR|nr:hypothetical protein CPB83DRAFT_905956 [Crepidotus variabilis]
MSPYPFAEAKSFMELMGNNINLPSRDTWFSVQQHPQLIDISRLILVSPVLNDAVSAASQNGPMVGGTEDNPLVMPDSVQFPVFRDFCGWFLLLNGVLDHELDLSQLENILEMSHYWSVDIGQAFAADRLASSPDLSPSYRMMLARRYHIHHWVDALTVELFNLPYSEITGLEVVQCSTDVWAVINKARDGYRDALNVLAVVPPSLPKETNHSFMPYCPNHKACIREWELVWYSKIGRRLLIKDKDHLEPIGVMEHVTSLSFPQMGRECRRDALELLQSNPNVFNIKHNVEQAAIDGVRAALGLPILSMT